MNRRTLIFLLVSASMTTLLPEVAYGAATNLPETGQAKCYSYSQPPQEIPCAGTGQDGDNQAGLAWPSPRFTENADTTLTDNLTGLAWAPDGNTMPARDGGWDTDGTANDGAVMWHHALDYVAQLNAENYLGHNDWRLPNVNELDSLLNADVPDSAAWLNSNGFSNVQSGTYWSSTTSVRASFCAWSVTLGFGSGTVLDADKSEDHFPVWPVRNGQAGSPARTWRTGQTKCYHNISHYEIPCAGTGQDGETQAGVAWPYPRFADSGNQAVTDSLTGLIWTKSAKTPGPSVCTPGTETTWQGALDHIKCLNAHSYLGYNDWRLPNRKEIRTLIDYSRQPPLPPGSPFTDVMAGFWDFQWSSTTDPQQTSEAWIVYMASGGVVSGSKTGSYHHWVCPVRAGAPPDLISEDGVAPLTACPGQALPITDNIRNIGGGTAGPSTTKFYLSADAVYDAGDAYLGSREVSSLDEGASDTGNATVTLPPATGAGTYYIISRADGNGVVSEADERNNDRSRSIKVGPDLLITKLSILSSCVEDALVGFAEVTVENHGGCPAGRSTIKFYASRNSDLDAGDIYLGYAQPVPYLAAGAVATRKISATVPPRIAVGSYYIIAYVDAYHSVSESDEGNNVRSRRVKIERCR